MSFKAINIYLHDSSNHNLFVEEQIMPAIEKYNKLHTFKCFLLRHWRKGPHLQLHIELNKYFLEKDLISLKEKLEKNIHSYLSGVAFSQSDLEKNYEFLKIYELETNPFFPLHEDGFIEISTSVLRDDIWGDTGVEAIRNYYCESNNLVLNFMTKIEKEKKYQNAISIMLASVKAIGDESTQQLSFRSHAEAFLNRFDTEDKIRKVFEHQYQSNKKNLSTLFQEILTNDSVHNEWVKIYKDLINTNKQLVEDNIINLPKAETYLSIIEENKWVEGIEGELSPFHKYRNSLPDSETYRNTSDFYVKRLVLNFMYLTLVQIGVKPLEKFSMCYSIARWFEDKLNKDWKKQLEEIVKI